ncbi:MAG TPA: DUF4340 domain-containing protein [Planctomycetota bacterium]|jgi:hypothetical protein
MIKPNIIVILVGICAVLVAAVFLVSGDRPKVSTAINSNAPLVKTFVPDSIKTVSIKKGDVEIKLQKKDKNWVMTSQKDRPAQTDRVTTLLNNIRDAKVENSRKAALKTFDLEEKGPASRTELVAESDVGKTTLFLGKNVEYSKCFVQTEAGGPVYEVDKGLDTDAGMKTEKDARILDAAYFYDLKVLNLTSDDIIDIAIKKGNEVTRVQKVLPGSKEPLKPKEELKPSEKPIWWITEPEGAAADDSNVGSICSTLATLNVKSYADTVPEKDRGFDKPTAKVKLRLKDGSEQTITFGKIDGDDVLVSVAGKPDPYKVYKYVYENITKDLKKKDEEKKPEGSAGMPPGMPPGMSPGMPPAHPPVTPPMPTLPKAEKKAEAPIPPPPAKIEAEKKPVVPPAVVKQPEPKIEEKK